ncbi:MAG: hypothetical protein P8L44_00655 [Opitutales bacterium]|nr:hypothetical protein [Opitutales bacterium]
MKSSILTIALGLTAGLIAHSLYFNSLKPCEEDTLECKLSWIQDYLSLTDDQFEVVLAMHGEHQPEVFQLEQRLASLEEERVENDRIDFIAFYNYQQDKVDLDKTRDSSTESFLAKIGDVMNVNQKARFDELLKDFKTSLQEES